MKKYPKEYCHRDDCLSVETGFQSRENFFFSCKSCKSEVTGLLHSKIEQRNKDRKEKEEKQIEKASPAQEEDDYLYSLGIANWYDDSQ